MQYEGHAAQRVVENTHHGYDKGEGETNLNSSRLQGRFGKVGTIQGAYDYLKE